MSNRKVIKISEVRELASIQCTKKETAGVLGISEACLRRKFQSSEKLRDAWEQGRANGHKSMRRSQIDLAKVNGTVSVHLGKIYLNQVDQKTIRHEGADGGPIEMVDFTNLKQCERDKLRQLLSKSTATLSG